jgi:hypothetical protein
MQLLGERHWALPLQPHQLQMQPHQTPWMLLLLVWLLVQTQRLQLLTSQAL